ncbi:MAG: hypothetical protein KJ592_00590 [Nanoarchaeota archaeon]|nr:hypothetical protein [Nanoarchaeota archaeon]
MLVFIILCLFRVVKFLILELFGVEIRLLIGMAWKMLLIEMGLYGLDK